MGSSYGFNFVPTSTVWNLSTESGAQRTQQRLGGGYFNKMKQHMPFLYSSSLVECFSVPNLTSNHLLQTLAIKIYSTVPNSMADERTVSTITGLNSAK
ncbi:hypothetical protein JVT61DRAFT_13432 [Boletus reticuloceps]|uniref:Uncharacterized protein n=1 Tax=Boletus reticuloceps TaxID=495285 RepID=A0A8I3A340_9AGAM|nr:hypothetical protein JVT61DRAFT_13432 [Boletus reticuloceps]